MKNKRYGTRRIATRLWPLVFAGAVGPVLGLMVGPSTAAIGQPIAEISELRCGGDPEVVVLRNVGTGDLQMGGLNLQSDPPDKESLPLGVLGFLAPGESVLIESGPSSEAAFVWSQEFVFRDNDGTDYARLASDEGVVLLQVNCDGTTPTATPSPTRVRATTPSPTALPATATPSTGVVPDGGGSPAHSVDLPSPTLVAALGGSLAVGGLALLMSPLLAAVFTVHGRAAAPSTEPVAVSPPVPKRGQIRRKGPARPYLLLCLAGLIIATLTILLMQAGDEH